MPSEKHLTLRLTGEIILNELTKQFIADHRVALVFVKVSLLQIITIVASQITARSGRFHHHIDGTRKGVQRIQDFQCRDSLFLIFHARMIHDEAIDVGLLFELFAQWLSSSMTSFRINTDKYGR